MRRQIALFALWVTAAVVCTTLGWLTVGIVSGQSRESSLPPLVHTATNPDDAQAAVVRPRPGITAGSTTTSTSTSTSTSTTSTSTTVPRATPEVPPPAKGADPAAGASLPTPAPAAAPLPPPPPPTTVAARRPQPSPLPDDAPPRASSTSATIASAGGSVAVSYGPTGTVTLLYATPHEGFRMSLRKTGPEEVEVRFESDDAESRVFAWWDDEPRQRVEERN